MTEEELKKKYYHTVPALNNYLDMALASRNLFITINDKYLKEMFENKESSQERDIAELLIYKEIFEKTCLSIETFSLIINALSKDLKDFSSNIINNHSPKGDLENIDSKALENILKLDDLSYMEEKDRETIEIYREKAIEFHLDIIKGITGFIDYYWTTFAKLKHGNTVIYKYEKRNIEGIDSYILPVLYNHKEPDKSKMLVLNSKIYNKLKLLYNTTIKLSIYYCYVNLQYIKRNETKFDFPSIAPKDLDQDLIYKIFNKYKKEINYNNINVSFLLEISKNAIPETLKVYKDLQFI